MSPDSIILLVNVVFYLGRSMHLALCFVCLGYGKDWLAPRQVNFTECDSRSWCWLPGLLVGLHYKVCTVTSRHPSRYERRCCQDEKLSGISDNDVGTIVIPVEQHYDYGGARNHKPLEITNTHAL